jgi:hypothetical protein
VCSQVGRVMRTLDSPNDECEAYYKAGATPGHVAVDGWARTIPGPKETGKDRIARGQNPVAIQ